MNPKSNHLTLKNVEKLIQIGRVGGNINIQGNIEKAVFSIGDDLIDALQESVKPEESLRKRFKSHVATNLSMRRMLAM